MKRFHVHVAVPDLESGIRFYTTLFGSEPSVVKPDYAKWMLEDPRLNFAISQRGGRPGVNHLGFQVESDGELAELRARVDAANVRVTEEKNVACCYARSDKHWVQDPAGIAWESFHSLGTVPFFEGAGDSEAAGCCTPADATAEAGCCASVRADRKSACCT